MYISRKTERFAFSLSQFERKLLESLAAQEGEPMAVTLRRLIRQAAREAGLLEENDELRRDRQAH